MKIQHEVGCGFDGSTIGNAATSRTQGTKKNGLFSANASKKEVAVGEILAQHGWDEKFCGLAAKGKHYFGMTGNLQGEHIGLWSRYVHTSAIALFDVNLPASEIAHAILGSVK